MAAVDSGLLVVLIILVGLGNTGGILVVLIILVRMEYTGGPHHTGKNGVYWWSSSNW